MKKKQSPTHVVTLNPGYRYMRQASGYLRNKLQDGWENYFIPCKTGMYYGLTIACPQCDSRPPKGMKLGRWRWLATHIAMHKRQHIQ